MPQMDACVTLPVLLTVLGIRIGESEETEG